MADADARWSPLVVIGAGIVGWLQPWQSSGEMAGLALDTRRIAVLPFANISADAADEYFSDGLTEELISQLSKIGKLRVIARTSSMKYKGTNQGIAEIGRALRVGTIFSRAACGKPGTRCKSPRS